MSLDNGDQLPSERKEKPRQSKISYSRDYLLSFSNLDICKQLPSGFDTSILSEFGEAWIIVNERHRGIGGTKRSDYGSSPPGAGGYSRGTSRWDVRSSSLCNRDGDAQSNREGFVPDSSRRFGTQSRRSWHQPEHDGLLGSGAYPRPSGYAGSAAPKARSTNQFHLNKTSAPYQPPRPYKAVPFQRKDDKDSCNDETFGSTNYSSEDIVEEERRRRESFELMRKEQHKALQEKQKQAPNNSKEKFDDDIIALLENSVDKRGIMNKNHDAGDSSLLSTNGSSNSSSVQSSIPRPLVPPGFSHTASDKNIPVQSSKAYVSSEACFAGTVDKHSQNGADNGQEKRNQLAPYLEENKLKTVSSSNLSVDGEDKHVIPPVGLDAVNLSVNANHLSCTTSSFTEVNENDVGNQNKSEVTHSIMQDGSTSILEKLLGGALSKGSISTPSMNQDFRTEGTLVPAISESSKFASWFTEEEQKHSEAISSKDLLSLIVNNEKVGSVSAVVSSNKVIENIVPSSPPQVGNTTEKLGASPGTPLMAGISEKNGKKSDSGPVVLTCEDLEQFILADAESISSDLQHAVQGPSATKDENFEPQQSNVDDRASQHILSLLQRGTKEDKEMALEASAGLDIGSVGKLLIRDTDPSFKLGIAEMDNPHISETESSSRKTLTLETLFGSQFMHELQSSQAPVSAQRVADGGINATCAPTSLGLPFTNLDTNSFSSNSNKLVQERDMVSLDHVQDANAHSILGLGKDQGNPLGETLIHNAVALEERSADVHLPDEDNLITGWTSSQMSRTIDHSGNIYPGFDHLTTRNQQMKPLIPEGIIHHNPHHNFPESVLPQVTTNHAKGPHLDPTAYHLMLQQMPHAGNFRQQLPLQGLPGVPLSHPINRMQGFIPEINNVHNISLHHQQPNYGGFGMGIPGNHPDPQALQRLMEMELRANAKQVHPAAAGHFPGIFSPELGMGFKFR